MLRVSGLQLKLGVAVDLMSFCIDEALVVCGCGWTNWTSEGASVALIVRGDRLVPTNGSTKPEEE